MPFALFVIPGGDVWKKHRKYLQPGFGPTHLQHTAKVAHETMLEFESLYSGSFKMNVHEAMTNIAMDIL